MRRGWSSLSNRMTLRTRMLILLLSLLLLIQLLTIVSVSVASDRFVKRQIGAGVENSARVLQQFFSDRLHQLILGATLLSDDFAFKQAYATGDRATIFSALENLRANRIRADLMLLLDDADLSTIVDTRFTDQQAPEFIHADMVEKAEEQGRPVWSVERMEDQLYRLIVVPLLAPEPVAWIVIGFEVDEQLANTLMQLTNSDIIFVYRQQHGDQPFIVSTLAQTQALSIANRASIVKAGIDTHALTKVNGESFAYSTTVLDEKVDVLLLRSVEQAMQPFIRLYQLLLSIALLGLVALVVGVAATTGQITRPVMQLVAGAQRVQTGDYSTPVALTRDDEIGQLAQAFNQMLRGLNAFHRFVPKRLVRTLLEKGIDAEPQHRFATILYSDIAGFTSVASELTPTQVVQLLNEYFTAISGPIERNSGAITQYQGDAILAVFNLFGDDPHHADHAVQAALEIQRIVSNQSFGTTQTELATRIGINSGSVVAGAVGSADQLNYTVHGDAVNLAARLETLNKQLGSSAIASASTYKLLSKSITVDELNNVKLPGKRETLTVYRLI